MTMNRLFSLVLVVSISPGIVRVVTAASAGRPGEVAPSSIHQHQLSIHQTNIFHVAPHAIISSVISDVRRHPSSSLNIDVSSNRLNDDGALSLLEGLLPHIQSILSADKAEMQELPKVTLALAMNNLTPSGVSNLLDFLVNNEDKEDENVNIPIRTNGTIEEGEPSSDLSMDGLINEDNNDQKANATNSSGLPVTGANPNARTQEVIKRPSITIEELDLSYNDFGGHGSHPLSAKLLDSVRRLCEEGRREGVTSAFIPRVLTFENCGIGPAFCRSAGRGILNAFENRSKSEANNEYRPSALRFRGNKAIGDAGTVALAAALRLAKGHENENDSHHVLEELDLSSCGVCDTGAEALALAIALNPHCLRRLDLSNNKISDPGASALGRALIDANRCSGTIFEEIILDNNQGITDVGAAALAEALASGSVTSISLRSCSVQAQGSAAFGKALVSLANCNIQFNDVRLDLSGNHFGTQKIAKKRGAAGRLRDKASTNIKFLGQSLYGAAKRFSTETMGITADTDDDEEIMGGLIEDDEEDIYSDKLQSCGGCAFARELIDSMKSVVAPLKISVGMRQCCLDDGAIDALSASILGVGMNELSIDVSMNSADDSIVHELKHAKRDSSVLAEMAQRHLEFMDRVANARQRRSDSEDEDAAINFGSYSDD